jgi:hypothetical protein
VTQTAALPSCRFHLLVTCAPRHSWRCVLPGRSSFIIFDLCFPRMRVVVDLTQRHIVRHSRRQRSSRRGEQNMPHNKFAPHAARCRCHRVTFNRRSSSTWFCLRQEPRLQRRGYDPCLTVAHAVASSASSISADRSCPSPPTTNHTTSARAWRWTAAATSRWSMSTHDGRVEDSAAHVRVDASYQNRGPSHPEIVDATGVRCVMAAVTSARRIGSFRPSLVRPAARPCRADPHRRNRSSSASAVG